MQQYDVVIVGGGVIGSAIAYFLASNPDFSGTVAVVERDPTYETCSTARSAGSIRQQFSTKENIEISLFGIDFIRRASEHLSVEGSLPEIGLKEKGYLFLASAEGLPILQENHALQKSLGADNAILSPDDLKARFPWMEVSDLAGGSLGLSMEGWLDPYALLQAFRKKAQSLGAVYLKQEVTGLTLEGRKVTAAKLANGEVLACGHLVNAAGPRAATVAGWLGIELPVRPRKRQVFVFDCHERLENMPLVIDYNGLYTRPEGQHYICGRAPTEGEEDPDTLDLEVDHSQFEDELWEKLAARIPAFEAIKPVGAWAGHYSVNTFDHNAVLGRHPEIENFIFANGFSGHGLQQSPAVGRAMMEIITYGGYRSLDLSRFGFARFAANQPIIEKNVV